MQVGWDETTGERRFSELLPKLKGLVKGPVIATGDEGGLAYWSIHLEMTEFSTLGELLEVGSLCLVTKPRLGLARVGTISVDFRWHRRGLGSQLYDVAFEWSMRKGLRFESGCLNDESLSYWENLVLGGRAEIVDINEPRFRRIR